MIKNLFVPEAKVGSIIIVTLIPQHYYKYNFLST